MIWLFLLVLYIGFVLTLVYLGVQSETIRDFLETKLW